MQFRPSSLIRNVFVPALLAIFTHPHVLFAQSATIVLDSGHDPEINGDFTKSGVIGTCGQAEYVYNDQVTDVLAGVLNTNPRYRVVRTRQTGRHVDFGLLPRMPAPGPKRTLYARPAIANAAGCSAYVSIHHDSTSKLHKTEEPGLCVDAQTGTQKPGLRLTDSFLSRFKVGYNVFVARSKVPSPRDRESLALATAVAQRIREMGRAPSNYHAVLRDCPTCRDVVPELGIMSQSLAVLRLAKCPAILIEVGNVIDPNDERLVSTPEFRQKFAEQVQLGLNDYFNQKSVR